jgi:hypothetical protein
MSPDDEEHRLAELLASQADHSSVTVDRLTGTADAIGDLELPVVAHLVDGEAVEFCFESHPDGISVGNLEDPLRPERGGVFAFTDLRVYLQMGLAEGDKSLSLTYDAVTAVEAHADAGRSRHRIELRAEGTTYHLWIPTAFDGEATVRAAEYATYRRKEETPDRDGETTEAATIEGDEPQTVHERLERLGDAKSRGLIDEEEFQRRKERLLDE